MDNIEHVKETVLEKRHVVIREITEDLNVSYRSMQHNFVNILKIKRIPKDLNSSRSRKRDACKNEPKPKKPHPSP